MAVAPPAYGRDEAQHTPSVSPLKVVHALLCGMYADVRAQITMTHTLMKAGTDSDCGEFFGKYAQSALDKKLVTEADFNKRLAMLFKVRCFRISGAGITAYQQPLCVGLRPWIGRCSVCPAILLF